MSSMMRKLKTLRNNNKKRYFKTYSLSSVSKTSNKCTTFGCSINFIRAISLSLFLLRTEFSASRSFDMIFTAAFCPVLECTATLTFVQAPTPNVSRSSQGPTTFSTLRCMAVKLCKESRLQKTFVMHNGFVAGGAGVHYWAGMQSGKWSYSREWWAPVLPNRTGQLKEERTCQRTRKKKRKAGSSHNSFATTDRAQQLRTGEQLQPQTNNEQTKTTHSRV